MVQSGTATFSNIRAMKNSAAGAEVTIFILTPEEKSSGQFVEL
jgi:hypothetical protein